jgi:virulence factor Mce-like protein
VRRVLVIGLVAAVVVAAAAINRGGGDGDTRNYTIEFDNAFGLVEGGDVRVAGVNAGEVVSLELDEKTQKALVEVALTEKGFGSLRSDARCETRPQSPIGEYFVDCAAGTSKREIEPGSRIPVRRTSSTIPPDLIANIMRLPYRERFRLIINEFGAGLAGRPEDLNEAIRRGVPALRQSANLLRVLADHRRTIRDLVGNADRVMKRLSDNRRNVGKFVVEARDTASASAERDADIQQNFNKLPRFLQELRPTLAALGEVADEQRPVLVDLNASARNLRRFFDDTADFSRASRPAVGALGDAAPIGRQAVRAARPQVRELRRYAERTPELGKNLRMTLEDFDDPSRAVENDSRNPRGTGGYTGLEAIPRWIFSQAMAINAFDELGHMLRVVTEINKCSPYRNAESVKNNRSLDECRAWLGPNQVGVTTPDPSPTQGSTRARDRGEARRRGRTRREGRRSEPGAPAPAPAPGAPPATGGPGAPPAGPQEDLGRLLDQVLGDKAPGVRPEAAPKSDALLDYLLGP